MEEVEEFFVLFPFTYDLLNKKAEFRIRALGWLTYPWFFSAGIFSMAFLSANNSLPR